MTDCHCHLADPNWGDQLPDRLEEARRHGIHGWLSCAYDQASWARQLELARLPGVRIALGIHPWEAESWHPSSLSALEAALTMTAPVALGECGLDFYRARTPQQRQQQLEVLRAQLDLAGRCRLPVVLHCVRAQQPLLRELEAYPRLGVMVHGFLGSCADAKAWLQRGAYLSLGPHAQSREDLMRYLPLDRVLIETDAPARGNSLLDLERIRSAYSRIQPVQPQHFESNLRRFLSGA